MRLKGSLLTRGGRFLPRGRIERRSGENGYVRRAITILASLLFWALAQTSSLRADWMNLTGAETAPNIAEITVLDDRVRIALEVYIGDLKAFRALVPDNWLKKNVSARPPTAERLRRFSEETFQVVTGGGTRLRAELKLVEPRLRKDRASPFAGMINSTTRQRVPEPPEDKRVLYAEIEYPFDGKPEKLTFIPPADEKDISTVTIGFIAYHKAVPVIDFRYLSKQATLTLDWSDPWYTKFDNPNLKRHHKSALMSFLYVEPREVRHEVLIRVRDLTEWADLELSGGSVLTVDEQARIKHQAQEFLAGHNPLKVDGVLVKPDSSRAEFLKISLTGLQLVEDGKDLDLSTATLGVILSYPIAHLPQQVSVQWELFNERIGRVPATSIDPAGPLPGFVEVSDPTFEWKNFLLKYKEPEVAPVKIDDGRSIRVPALSAAFLLAALAAGMLAIRPQRLSRRSWLGVSVASAIAGVLLLPVAVVDVPKPIAGAPDEQTAAKIVKGVLENVNHAYLEKDPAALRDALSGVVADNTLGDVQPELGRALLIKVAGGGVARVTAIENLALKDVTELKNKRGFRAVAEWTAKAKGGHWGHIHRRLIQFRALLEMIEDDGYWKLAGITIVDAKQKS